MKLREVTLMDKLNGPNDGTRTLMESIIAPEIVVALKDWIKACGEGVLIGGIALSYYIRPRGTTDIDLLFLSASDIPKEVQGFKRIREHAFQHNKTHVEIEVLDAAHIKLAPALVQKIIDTAVLIDGIKVASKNGMVASKLDRGSFQDKSDIVNLIKTGAVDISEFPLSDKEQATFNECLEYAKTEGKG